MTYFARYNKAKEQLMTVLQYQQAVSSECFRYRQTNLHNRYNSTSKKFCQLSENVLVQMNYNCLLCVARLTHGCCNDDRLQSVDHSLQQVHDSEVPSIHLDALAN